MSRRSSSGDQDFGSDSFLDIIANIVGILIILIVVAGLRVAQQPLESATDVDTVVADSQSTEIILDDSQNLELHAGNFDSPIPDLSTLEVPIFEVSARDSQDNARVISEPITPPDSSSFTSQTTPVDLNRTPLTASDFQAVELERAESQLALQQTELFGLQRQLRQLEEELTPDSSPMNSTAQLSADLVSTTKQIGQSEERLTDTVLKQQQIQTTLAALDEQHDQVRQRLDQIQRASRELQDILDDQPKAAPTSRLKHRILPVSRTTSSNELHFLLAKGRVARVPIDELGDRAARMVRRRADILRKVGAVTVLSGPDNGFQMEFTARLQPDPRVATVGNLNQKFTYHFQVRPTDTVPTESVDVALKIGSRFRQLLEAAEPSSHVTIWLYDNEAAFAQFAKLRDLAYQLDLRVAAWPLKASDVIQGSSGGFQSSAQ